MSFRVQNVSELRGTLGNRTFSVGRDTRRKMVSQLFGHSKLSYGMEAGTRHIVVGLDPGTGKHVHFQMHDSGAGGLNHVDIDRLAHEFFGSKHGGQMMMSKNEMAINMVKKMHGMSKSEALRLVETMINEMHGSGHAIAHKEEGKAHENKTKPDLKKAEIHQESILGADRYGEHGEVLVRKSARYGEHGEILDQKQKHTETHKEPSVSDPKMDLRGGLSGHSSSDIPERPAKVFRDLHFH